MKILRFVLLLCGFCLLLPENTFSQKKRRVEILNSDSLIYERRGGASQKRLIGHVKLRHEGVLMYCDSASLFDNINVVEAYNNVHIQQGDTLHLYGDFMRYKGDVRTAEFRRNVLLVDRGTSLKTHFLDYNLTEDLGYYYQGGVIYNEQDTLESRQGYYYADQKLFFFSEKVIMRNPEYTIRSDSLKYNTETEVSYFYGPTEIIGDSSYIYCENGWYDSNLDISQFSRNAYMVGKEQTIRGDSLYYNNGSGFGMAFRNVEIFDSAQQVILRGHYAIYHREPEQAMITDSALFIQFSEGDSVYIHADTLRSVTAADGSHKILSAYYRVKLFRDDLQGKCDSLSYSFTDSIIQLHGGPALWSEENQLTADFIEIHTRNRKVEHIEMHRSAFIISQEDSLRYNQIKGKDMYGYFRDGKLYRIDVMGNGQTIYFVRDEEDLVGVNKAESSNLVIYLEDKKIQRINLITKPDGIMNPPGLESAHELRLKDFVWLDPERPKSRYDIFRWK